MHFIVTHAYALVVCIFLVGYLGGYLHCRWHVAFGSPYNATFDVLRSWWTVNVKHRRVATALEEWASAVGLDLRIVSEPVAPLCVLTTSLTTSAGWFIRRHFASRAIVRLH